MLNLNPTSIDNLRDRTEDIAIDLLATLNRMDSKLDEPDTDRYISIDEVYAFSRRWHPDEDTL